jgi:hypothetical protein
LDSQNNNLKTKTARGEAGKLLPQSIVFRIFLDRYRYDKLGDSILTLSNVESLLNSIHQSVHSTLTPETLPTSSSDIHTAHHHSALLYQNTVHTISRGSLFSPPESVARGYIKISDSDAAGLPLYID